MDLNTSGRFKENIYWISAQETMLKTVVEDPHSPQPPIVFKSFCLLHIIARSEFTYYKKQCHKETGMGDSKIVVQIGSNLQLFFLAHRFLFAVVYKRFVQTAALLSAHGNFH